MQHPISSSQNIQTRPRTRGGRLALAVLVAALLSAIALPVVAQSLSSGTDVEIRVLSRKKKPLVGARVELTYRDAGGLTSPAPLLTDQKGRVIFYDLPSGAWHLEASHPGNLSFLAVLSVPAAGKPEITASFLQATGDGIAPTRVAVQGLKRSGQRVAFAEAPARPKAVTPETDTSIAQMEPKEATPVETVAEETAPQEPITPIEIAIAPTAVEEPLEPAEEAAAVVATAPTSAPLPDPTPAREAVVEAVASEPVVAEPVVPEPVLPEPVVTQPVSTESVAATMPEPMPEPMTEPMTEPAPEPRPEPATALAPQPTAAVSEQVVESTPVIREPVVTEAPVPAEPTLSLPEATVSKPSLPVTDVPVTDVPVTDIPEPSLPEATVVESTLPEVATAEPSMPATPEPAAESPPVPTPTPTPIDPSQRIAAPERLGGSILRDPESAEWAAAEERVVAPGGDIPCPAGLEDAVRRAMWLVADAANLELSSFAGPVFDEGGNPAFPHMRTARQERVEELLRPYKDSPSGCMPIAVVLPKGSQFIGFHLLAADDTGAGACEPQFDCPIGNGGWIGTPNVGRGPSSTVVYGIFKNADTTRERRIRLTARFIPPSEAWGTAQA